MACSEHFDIDAAPPGGPVSVTSAFLPTYKAMLQHYLSAAIKSSPLLQMKLEFNCNNVILFAMLEPFRYLIQTLIRKRAAFE